METEIKTKGKDVYLLFKGEMIAAALAGRKTQTRRIAKTPGECRFKEGDRLYGKEGFWAFGKFVFDGVTGKIFEWDKSPRSLIYYSGQPSKPDYQPYYSADCDWSRRSSLFMPQWACRVRGVIVRAWQERLQDISEEDAIAEGIEAHPTAIAGYGPWRNYVEGASPVSWFESPIVSYMSLWDSINGTAYPWSSNPLVDVAEFKLIFEEEINENL